VNYNEQMQELASDYMAATGNVMFRTADIGLWARENGRWQPSQEAILRQFSSDMSKALREEYYRDSQGRRVRTKAA
jgi:hypothetical protein